MHRISWLLVSIVSVQIHIHQHAQPISENIVDVAMSSHILPPIGNSLCYRPSFANVQNTMAAANIAPRSLTAVVLMAACPRACAIRLVSCRLPDRSVP
jgi:hypothetical protein